MYCTLPPAITRGRRDDGPHNWSLHLSCARASRFEPRIEAAQETTDLVTVTQEPTGRFRFYVALLSHIMGNHYHPYRTYQLPLQSSNPTSQPYRAYPTPPSLPLYSINPVPAGIPDDISRAHSYSLTYTQSHFRSFEHPTRSVNPTFETFSTSLRRLH